jgi:hypothetical protein
MIKIQAQPGLFKKLSSLEMAPASNPERAPARVAMQNTTAFL